MLLRLAAAALVLLLGAAGCSSDDPEAGSSPASDRAAPEPDDDAPEADPWPARVAKWEKANAIPTSDWYELVTGVAVDDFLGVVDVETTIVNDADAVPAAEPICGSYATIGFDYPKLSVVRVLARDGGLITKCGPGANVR